MESVSAGNGIALEGCSSVDIRGTTHRSAAEEETERESVEGVWSSRSLGKECVSIAHPVTRMISGMVYKRGGRDWSPLSPRVCCPPSGESGRTSFRAFKAVAMKGMEGKSTVVHESRIVQNTTVQMKKWGEKRLLMGKKSFGFRP